MRIHLIPSLVVVVALCGCGNQAFQAYYPDRSDPQVPMPDGQPLGSESGNAGGKLLAIEGSGFGADPDDVTVLLGNHNAKVLSITDARIEIETPVGPITGGLVNLVVATPTGYTEVKNAYEYDTRTSSESAVTYDRQENYILVQNYWNSCLGGMGLQSGCEGVAYIGETGLEGRSEYFEFFYPRLHNAYIGFVTTADHATEWQVSTGYDQPFPSGIDELRKRVSNFSLVNDTFADESVCIDLAKGKIEVSGSECGGASVRTYPLDRMQFCEGVDPVDGPTKLYGADWPVVHNFFEGPEGAFAPVTVRIDAPSTAAGLDQELDGISLELPGIVDLKAEVGFKSQDAFWSVQGMQACGDGNGDGQATLDEDGIRFTWAPSPDGLGGDGVTAVNSYVHVSVTLMSIGWFGVEGYGMRASIVVPDGNQVDPETGRASVGIPNSVLYQFPTANSQWSTESTLTQTGTLGTSASEASYVLVEFVRVTDYRIETPKGVTVFSYATGDLSFVDWKNPMQQVNDCYDCIDGDGDGWTDAKDPDCNRDVGGNGLTEGSATSAFTCNDGLDNNGDGLIDADDPLCLAGWHGETNCGDGIDNDGDGWIDGLDGECPPGDPFASELGNDDPSWTCSDGLDNDGDGWIDRFDPGCSTGADLEDDGLSGFACNDGIDNDGDGFIDADDFYCAQVGGGADSESPELKSQCADGIDNDGDGFIDGMDFDCELAPHTRETRKFMDPNDSSQPWFGYVPECYDGLDNDGDGTIDGADPNCWNPLFSFAPDSYMNGESAPQVYPAGHPSAGQVTGCSDGLDGDADGWFDGADPDCQPGSADTQEEVGFDSRYQCNDGIDNDGDGLIDAADVDYCKKATGNFEGP